MRWSTQNNNTSNKQAARRAEDLLLVGDLANNNLTLGAIASRRSGDENS
jgi:hypothetical protein